MRHNQRGGGLQDRAQGILDHLLGVHVEGAEWVIQHQHLRLGGHRASQGEALALTTAEAHALLTDEGVEAVRQLVGKGGLRDFERLRKLGLAGVRLAEQNVIAHARAKQRGVLEGHRDVLAQLLASEVTDVHPVEQNLTRGDIVEPGGECGQGALAASGDADESHRFTRFDHQVNALEQLIAARLDVGELEVHVLELQAAKRCLNGLAIGWIHDFNRSIQHLKEALHSRLGIQGHREHETNRLGRPAHHGGGGEECHQGAHRNLMRSHEPDTREQRKTGGEFRHQNQVDPDTRNHLGLLDFGLAELVGILGEFARHVVAATKGLEHAHTVNRLFHAGCEVSTLVLAEAGHRVVPALKPEALDPDWDAAG